MSREIKFRAWDKEERVIRTVLGFSLYHGAVSVDIGNGRYLQDDSSRFDLMQYTGLKDINGTAIYDGYVVRCDSRFGRRALEVFQARTGEWRAEHDRGGQVLAFCCEECEVIGNIYENPELLKE